MTRSGSRAAVRAVAAVRGTADLVLVVRPDTVLDALTPGSARPPRGLVRLLGARVVLQQLLVLAAPTRRTVVLGAAVDGLHAASMVAAALRWPQHRGAAALSAASAAAAGLLALAVAPPPSR